MGYPMVSIIWVNYNSSKFIDVVLESLHGIINLDYPSYELIVVDNGSTDGSFEIIKNFLEKKSNLRKKIISLERNIGFTGGNNVGYRAKDPDSKYVILLNNDAIPYSSSLRYLVEFMEVNPDLGAAQGVILTLNGKFVDTAGGFMSELLTSHHLFKGHVAKALKKPVYITYADGSYSIYRIEAVKKAVGSDDRLFNDYIFAYYEDSILCLKIWNIGYKIMSIPIITARHRRGSAFRSIKPLQLYLSLRNRVIMSEISNSRYKEIAKILIASSALKTFLYSLVNTSIERNLGMNKEKYLKIVMKAIEDGLRLGKARKKYEYIDIYRAPIIKIEPSIVMRSLLLKRAVAKYFKETLHKAIYAKYSMS